MIWGYEMDLKALMTKLEAIDKKQVLTESEDRKPAKEKEREVTLPSGAKVKARTVQGWQSQKADKEADKEKKKDLDENIVLQSAIAKELLKEFNISVEEETLDEAGEFQFSPEQEKWLGGANRQDPFILARMPGPKPPLSYFTNPEDKQIAQQRFAKVFVDAPAGGQGASPAAAPAATGTTAQGDDEGNTMITKPDGSTMVVGPDGNAIKPGSNPNLPVNQQAEKDKATATQYGAFGEPPTGTATASAPAGAPGAQDDATGVDAAVAANAADDAKRAAQAGGAGQAASPAKKPAAAPAANKSMTPAITGYAASMGLLKGGKPDVEAIKKFQKENGLTADGIIGPNTAGAILSVQKPGAAGSGRGGQGGPTAAELQKAGATQAASPNPQAQKIQAEIDRFSKANNMSLKMNQDYVAKLQAKLAQAQGQGGQAPSPAPAQPAKGPQQMSDPLIPKKAAAPAPGAGKPGPTQAAAAGQDPSNPLNKAPAGGTTTSTTNTSVSGTMKMGKPDGPIQYNGKTVNPGDPEYGAASQALIAQSQKAQQARSNMGAPRGAPSTAPVQQGATLGDKDFEESILARIRELAGM